MAGLFKTKTPTLPPPVRMPDPEDPAVRAARLLAMQKRRGSSSQEANKLVDRLGNTVLGDAVGSAGKDSIGTMPAEPKNSAVGG